jgi:hypothetical protein
MKASPLVVFVIVMVIGLPVLRKVGWVFSEALLYPSPIQIAVVLCMGWACLIAYLTRYLIEWQHLGTILKVVAYGAGGYVSIPNFGLFREDTVPADTNAKHTAISALPLPVYIIASVAFAFFIKVKRWG